GIGRVPSQGRRRPRWWKFQRPAGNSSNRSCATTAIPRRSGAHRGTSLLIRRAGEEIMIEITRILCPVDLSEISRRALEHATALARWYDAQLTVLHVVPSPAAAGVPALVDGHERERTMADLKCFAGPTSDVRAEVCVREATDIHRAILERAESTHADL